MPKTRITILDGKEYTQYELRNAREVDHYSCDICGAVVANEAVCVMQITPIMAGSWTSLGRAAVNAYVHASCLVDKAAWLVTMFASIYGAEVHNQIRSIASQEGML